MRDETYTDNDANGDNVIYALTPTELDRLIRDLESDYPPMAYHAMMNILDSHDTSRLLFVAGDDERQQLAALIAVCAARRADHLLRRRDRDQRAECGR